MSPASKAAPARGANGANSAGRSSGEKSQDGQFHASTIFGEDESSRGRILRIATELFAANGYDATGVQEISEAVGLGRGALYYHINSKQALLFDIVNTIVLRMTEDAASIAALDLPPDRKLHELARDLLRKLAENRAGSMVSAYEIRALSKDQRRDVVKARNRFEKVWQDAFTEAAEVGYIRPASPLIVRGVLGMLNSTHLWIRMTGPSSPEQVADAYLDLVINGLRSPEQG